MRKFELVVLAGMAFALGAPHVGSAMPLVAASGVKAAVESISTTEEVTHGRPHKRSYRRARRCG